MCRGSGICKVGLAQGNTVILHICHLAVIDCQSLRIHTVILQSLVSFSTKMTLSPMTRLD
jgi:hypothetical protein